MIPPRTSAFYIANLGSEVSRLQSALEKKDRELTNGALERTRRIFDELGKMPLRESEHKEIEILRSVIEDLPKINRRFSVSVESLNAYFYPFARKVLRV